MQIISRAKQASYAFHAEPADVIFDGEPIPREITPRAWLQEGTVHQTRTLTRHLSRGSEVILMVLNDADLEPGKVVFDFNDPAINILDVKISDLRNAIIKTDAKHLAGKRLSYDVHTLFHRHFGETLVEGEPASSAL